MTQDESDIYSEEVREEMMDSDAISPSEEGFMEGASDLGQGAKCRNCGKPLGDKFVEEEINEESCRFCSDECAEEYQEKKKREKRKGKK